jgi:hypothetical protein
MDELQDKNRRKSLLQQCLTVFYTIAFDVGEWPLSDTLARICQIQLHRKIPIPNS